MTILLFTFQDFKKDIVTKVLPIFLLPTAVSQNFHDYNGFYVTEVQEVSIRLDCHIDIYINNNISNRMVSKHKKQNY